MVLSQLQALAITLAVEGGVAALAGPRFGATRLRAAAAAIGGSLVTHPFVWLGILELYPVHGPVTVPLFEAGAIAAETVAYRLIATRRWRDAIALSVMANLASWSLGFALQRLL